MIRVTSTISRRRHRPTKRRGSLYVAVLMVGALVSVLGMSALLVGRVTQRAHSGIADTVAARMNAHAAIRLGMLEIEENPDWRFAYTESQWYSDRPLGTGTFSLVVTDPSDNDLTDAAADPIVLTGIGRQGEAVHRTQVTLAPTHRGYDCLGSAIHGGDDVRFYDALAGADHDITANDDISASNSYVAAACAAVDRITGSHFAGSTTQQAEARDLPPTADVLDFYLEHGTWIDPADLPTQFADLIRNGGFEVTDDFWQPLNATQTLDNSTAATGQQCLQVTDRISADAGVQQDVTQLVVSERVYTVEFSVQVESVDAPLYVHLLVEDGSGQTDFVSSPIMVAVPDMWMNVAVDLQPVFDTSMTSAQLIINSSADSPLAMAAVGGSSTAEPFRIDDVRMREAGSVLNLDHVLLSPQHNPFGAANERGIYLLDMRGRQLVVRNSRIYGTLVLIDPASTTKLGDDHPLWLSPAVPGYPALLVSGDECRVHLSPRGLSEAALQVNMNPDGAPFDGIGTDSDLDDVYASGIDGLVYSTHRIRLKNLPMRGVVISDNDVVIEGGFLIRYDNRYYRNPPPGFSGPEQIRILLGSARRVTE